MGRSKEEELNYIDERQDGSELELARIKASLGIHFGCSTKENISVGLRYFDVIGLKTSGEIFKKVHGKYFLAGRT